MEADLAMRKGRGSWEQQGARSKGSILLNVCYKFSMCFCFMLQVKATEAINPFPG